MTTPKEVPVETDLAVRRLISRYCHLVDDRDFDQVPELFTDDARLNVLGTDVQGRSAIRKWLDSIPDPTFHHVTNVVTSNGSHGTVHAISDCQVGGRHDGRWSTLMLGRYHDTFVGQGRDLRFSQRLFTAR